FKLRHALLEVASHSLSLREILDRKICGRLGTRGTLPLNLGRRRRPEADGALAPAREGTASKIPACKNMRHSTVHPDGEHSSTVNECISCQIVLFAGGGVTSLAAHAIWIPNFRQLSMN